MRITSGKTIFFVAGATSLLLLTFAYFAYPVPAGDALYFVVPAVQFTSKGELTSPLYPPEWMIDKIIDPTGMKRFLFYPPLFPLSVSVLMPEATPRGALLAIAFINVAVLCLSTLFFYKVAKKKKGAVWQKTLIVGLALIALASSLAENGRPEVLARLWLVLACLVPWYISKKYAYVVYGILAGLMFATHPPAGIFSLLILGIVFGVIYKWKDVVFEGSKILGIGFMVALGGIAVGPFGVRETIEATFRHVATVNHIIAEGTEKWFTLSNVITHYVSSPATPFYGLVIILFVVESVLLYWKYRARLASPLITLLCAVILMYALGKVTYNMGHVFYISLFAPLMFAIFILFFLEQKWRWKSATVIILLLVATGFVRTALLFPFFLKQEVTLETARADFAKRVISYEGKDKWIGVTGGLWTLTEKYEKVYAYNTWPEKPKKGTALIFFQERYSGMRYPPAIDGCALTYDAFSKRLPQIFGIKLGNTMPGYGYAVYDCFNL